MPTPTHEIIICTECRLILANGVDERDPKQVERAERIAATWPNSTIVADLDDEYLMHIPCGACGEGLFGDRCNATVFRD